MCNAFFKIDNGFLTMKVILLFLTQESAEMITTAKTTKIKHQRISNLQKRRNWSRNFSSGWQLLNKESQSHTLLKVTKPLIKKSTETSVWPLDYFHSSSYIILTTITCFFRAKRAHITRILCWTS